MSTLAQITAAINDDIRNKTPLVLKTEHADVEQLITNEMFPDSVVVQWNGTAPVAPITDIVCNPLLPTQAKCVFKIYFTKYGNRVFYKGFLTNTDPLFAIGSNFFSIILCTFPTNLYKPLLDHYSISNLQKVNGNPETLQNSFIRVTNGGVGLRGAMLASIFDFSFEGSYKVAN